MNYEAKVRKIGNSYGIVLSKEVLQAMHVEEGSVLYLTPSTEGSMRITPNKPGFAEKSAIANSLMVRYRNALRELAK